jgi:hypothetical protein
MPNLILFYYQLRKLCVIWVWIDFQRCCNYTLRSYIANTYDQFLIEIRNNLIKEELNYDLFNLKSQHSLNFPFSQWWTKNNIWFSCCSHPSKETDFNLWPWHEGTGKTFLWHTHIINCIRFEGLVVLVMASSGITSSFTTRWSYNPFKIQNPTYYWWIINMSYQEKHTSL